MKRGSTAAVRAIVTNIMNKEAKILSKHSELSCSLTGDILSGKNKLAVGDWIEAEDIGNSQYRALHILPRKTAVYRGNRRSPGEEILIAANAEILLVVVPADYLMNQAGYPEAAIIAAGRANIEIGIFISKWDEITGGAQEALLPKIELYRSVSNFVIAGSAGDHHRDLAEKTEGKTVLVVGDRSCGKTTLINGHVKGRTGPAARGGKPVSTNAVSLLRGNGETMWIDTPGFRDFALQHITEEERNTVFHEIAEHAVNCRFRNCRHIYEDECQVIEGVRKKLIKRERYEAYKKMNAPDSASSHEPKIDYRHSACAESFTCKVCGTPVPPEGAGSRHRNHCPKCLSSVHVDDEPGDRASLCRGIMDPISVWVRKDGEWAVIHRCRSCGVLSSNRIAADDSQTVLMSIAVKPLAAPPFPLYTLDETG
ncbi:RNHCP domain-containing protein [Breznakiella homolactica]|uniref:RNHCP domain-containing protein n=1 Tax=Breznakiella homolactica TaxID=2798577 RepID=A0A7T7XQC7_9SPIR|nr:RNHCP domain-containing protein [Breznakiella homolactica]QQO10453.1 RNHCP domain-containing protein [Breznakiella homolactica]